ncbi:MULTISPECIES: hypothetical protein [Candidatus Nitrosocaldus]|jgi:hypothetical protein|uniref:Uncharacterized protein n=1 Tax=Candidatus Nitrosocaldus cavascurensis TaxID=2058097 RepID=A0A2K5ARG7_9ARCH|nr:MULTISPECIES: hypothetical protein [Candidatus Nitrosocaldus]SPC34252.1 conserved protein of unknown function [Candidatus Nitrosocaldus cavascurensis]
MSHDMKDEKDKEKRSIVYTIEECQQCGVKNKRIFKVGDYVYKFGGSCLRCKGSTLITMIYAEYVNGT